jgi:hypothetical protein
MNLFFSLQYQQKPTFSQTNRKRRTLRGLQKKSDPLFTPLNGFAFGEGSGVAFAIGNSQSTTPENAAGASQSKTAAAGGGFGGGVGYVDATNVGSAYGGGRGGGNVSSLEDDFGVNKGSYAYAVDGGKSNTTFNGVASGGGFGSGIFGGLFVLEADMTLEAALTQTALDAAGGSKKGKGKNKDKTDAQIAEEAASIAAGFYGSFGNTTGGGGGGFGFTGLYASGESVATPSTTLATTFAKGNSGVNASASGFGFGGGSTNVGNSTAAGGGFGGGDSQGSAGGDIEAGTITDNGLVSFNATGGGSADGGGAGFVGFGLNPDGVAGVLNSP